MTRQSILAAALLSSVAIGATGAHAASCTSSLTATPHGAPIWVGVMRFVKQSAGCGANQFFNQSDIARSLYRPYLVSGDNPSAFTHYLGSNHAMLITNTTSATAQFSGTGTYRLCGISEEADFSGPINSTYSFKQLPSTVAANTTTITLNGQINRYANIPGCSLTFQAIYIRDPQTVP